MLPHDLPDALVKAVLRPLAALLHGAAGNDPAAAWSAAVRTIESYAPRTEVELRLAVRIVTFSIQAGEAVAQAGAPEMPLLRAIRLRAGAVALSREAEKAERRLEKLRAARLGDAPVTTEAEADDTPPPAAERAIALVEDTRKVGAYAQAHGLSWTEARKQRERDRRLADRHARQAAKAPPHAPPAMTAAAPA